MFLAVIPFWALTTLKMRTAMITTARLCAAALAHR